MKNQSNRGEDRPNPNSPLPAAGRGRNKGPNRFIISGQKVELTKIQAAKDLRRDMTEAEALLWQALRRNQMEGLHFRRQQVIDGFIVDFFCSAAGLVIEVDGGIHESQKEYDLERDKVLARRGLKVLRVSNEAVQNDMSWVLKRITELVKETT